MHILRSEGGMKDILHNPFCKNSYKKDFIRVNVAMSTDIFSEMGVVFNSIFVLSKCSGIESSSFIFWIYSLMDYFCRAVSVSRCYL